MNFCKIIISSGYVSGYLFEGGWFSKKVVIVWMKTFLGEEKVKSSHSSGSSPRCLKRLEVKFGTNMV